MSVLIKGMEMPKTCEECCLESFCNLWIEAIKMSGVELKVGAKATIRHPDCPLVPIPEHGRLIDADEFFKALTMDDCVSILEAMHVQSILSEAPTVIPADPVKEETE